MCWWYSTDFRIWWQNGIHVRKTYMVIVIHVKGESKLTAWLTLSLLFASFFDAQSATKFSTTVGEGVHETYFAKNHAEQGLTISCHTKSFITWLTYRDTRQTSKLGCKYLGPIYGWCFLRRLWNSQSMIPWIQVVCVRPLCCLLLVSGPTNTPQRGIHHLYMEHFLFLCECERWPGWFQRNDGVQSDIRL